MARILWSPTGRQSLVAVAEYVVEQSGSLETGIKLIDAIEAKCKTYARFPGAGLSTLTRGSTVTPWPTHRSTLQRLALHSQRAAEPRGPQSNTRVGLVPPSRRTLLVGPVSLRFVSPRDGCFLSQQTGLRFPPSKHFSRNRTKRFVFDHFRGDVVV